MDFWRKENFNILDLQNQVPTIHFDLSNTDYKYIEKIGTGTYGIVCQAEHIQTKQYYAIKKIKNPFNHKVTLVRTLREIRILNHFNHANIINIVDIFLKDSNNSKDIYVVFDLMESDLHKIITSKQMLSDDHIRYFMYQLICGVNYIHSASVIHRDLKPANILINSNCHLKIADFGMARLLITATKCDTNFPDNVASLNMTQYVMTRWYRAPELIMGQISYNTKIDLWSCGCILAELYLKEPLFRGDNMINQLKEIIRKMGTPENQFRAKVLPIVNSLINAEGHLKPIPLNNLIKNAPKKVIDLLSHLLVYDPDQRWSASQTLKHIFFLKYKNPSKEEICKSNLDLSFEIKLNSIDLLKDALLGDISSINSKQISFNLMNDTNFSKEIDDYSRKPILSSCEIQSLNRSESPISQRTLSADSGKELGYPIIFFELETSSSSSFSTNNIYKDNRLKTVSQFTKNKLINSIQKPKNKSKKIITAAQRQKERQDRKLKLKHKRDENFNINKVITKYQEPLSDLDKSYLKKWEHLTKSTVNINEKNEDQEIHKNCYENTSIIKNTKYHANEVDEMSAGLSALLLLDDIIENDQNITTRALNFNSNQNENISSDNLDLLFDVDIDCIDLDLSILESYSVDLLKE